MNYPTDLSQVSQGLWGPAGAVRGSLVSSACWPSGVTVILQALAGGFPAVFHSWYAALTSSNSCRDPNCRTRYGPGWSGRWCTAAHEPDH